MYLHIKIQSLHFLNEIVASQVHMVNWIYFSPSEEFCIYSF